MAIINLPLTRYDVSPGDGISRFMLYSIVGCDLVLELPNHQASDESVSSILSQIGAALDAFKAKKHAYRFHQDEDQEPTVYYSHEFSIRIGNDTYSLSFSLSEELISEDAFMLPDRKSWVDEIAEELG
ncbi:hypothetical protein [Elstera sp.]|jgi:hypothetical protein|uniref:hypothetical protein n=1 Tax=Elstera sp. TaxID=1916664 RepID=UPI0037BEA7C2